MLSLVSRLKVMRDLNIAEHRLPQALSQVQAARGDHEDFLKKIGFGEKTEE